MIAFDRTDQSIFGRWWWTVDRWMLAALAVLVGYGVILIMAASPAVAERIGLDTYHFVEHHLAMLVPSAVLPAESNILINPRHARFGEIQIGDAETHPFDRRLFGQSA